MLTHVRTSSALCGYKVGSKGEAVADLEKEKEETDRDRTLASARPDADVSVRSVVFGRAR
jgi:hypothetical protein